MTFSFEPPKRLPQASAMANMALQLAAISSRLALEERTLVNHRSGRAENVAEHSYMLALVAPAIAEEFYSDLDAALVTRFALIHDAVEAYVGDTATHAASKKDLLQKDQREALGLEKLKIDYAWLPRFTSLLEEYEKQQSKEARFVRIIDKWAPILVHFAEGGATLRGYTNSEELFRSFARRAAEFKKQYPDFTELVEVREELTRLAAKHLL